MSRVLVTGFEPFGGSDRNPSGEIAEALGGVVLPVSYARAADALRAAVSDADPDIVVCFGQAERESISVELFAHNLDGAESEDNDGVASTAEIDPDGPVAYRTTLPVDAILEALAANGTTAETSRDAGGFLCNHLFYILMRLIEEERPDVRGGFVHVPSVTTAEEAVRVGSIVIEACMGSFISSRRAVAS